MLKNICLSRNFTFSELTHTNRSRFFKENQELAEDYLGNLYKLAFVLQCIRDRCGFPLYINSGFRCPSLNTAVGGAPASSHLKGLAADIRIPSESEEYVMLCRAISLFSDLGIISYVKVNHTSNYIHISIVNNG